MGFVSIFLVWRIGRPDLFTASYTLAMFLDPNYIWDLMQTWPFQLAVISGLLFLGGCIALLFTRWGVIAQILGLIAFLGFYLTFPYGFQYTALGIGFYVGVLSAVIIVATDLIKRRSRTPQEMVTG
jgi:hypothetical protein